MSTADTRKFPAPLSISQQAQAVLNNANLGGLSHSAPEPGDVEGWRRHIDEQDQMLDGVFSQMAPRDRCSASWDRIAAVPVVRVRPSERRFPEGKLVLDIHGGALVYMGGKLVEPIAMMTCVQTGCDVVALDYRMPPDHPFPAALDDCLAVYKELLKQFGPENLIVTGSSAGGNLGAALMLRARDEALPMPAGLVLLSPETDLTESGDTFQTLMGIDRMGLHTNANLLYANGQPLDHPLISPLFGDLSGFPPTFLQSGTRDLFLSNTVRTHRALRTAGVEAELHIWEAMPHGGFFGAPEDDEVDEEVRRFLSRQWGC